MWGFIVATGFYLFLLWLAYTRIFGAEYFPTSKRVALSAIKMLRLGKKDIFYDLGSGLGGVVFLASKKCKAYGIEIDFFRWLYAFVKGKIINSKAVFLLGSYNRYNIKDANAIFVFLRQKTNQKIKAKLLKSRKGTKIVSYMHTFEDWKPVKTDKKNKLNLYVIGKGNK